MNRKIFIVLGISFIGGLRAQQNCHCDSDSLYSANNAGTPKNEGDSGLYLNHTTRAQIPYTLAFNDPYALPEFEWRLNNQIGTSQAFKNRLMLFSGTDLIFRLSPNHESHIEAAAWGIGDPKTIKTCDGEIKSKFYNTTFASVRHIWYYHSTIEHQRSAFNSAIEFTGEKAIKCHEADEITGNKILYKKLRQSGVSLGFQTLDGIYKVSTTRTESFINSDGKLDNRSIQQSQQFPFHARVLSLGFESRSSSVWLVKGNNGKIAGEGRSISCGYIRFLYAPVLTGQGMTNDYQTINRFAGASHFGFAIGGGWPGMIGFGAELGSMPGMGTYAKITLFPLDFCLTKSNRMMNKRLLEYNESKGLQ